MHPHIRRDIHAVGVERGIESNPGGEAVVQWPVHPFLAKAHKACRLESIVDFQHYCLFELRVASGH